MKIGIWASFLIALMSYSALAELKGKITEFKSRDHLLSAEFPDDHGIKEGDFILLPFEPSYRCRLEVIKVLGNAVIAHTRHCSFEGDIKKGQEIESDPYGDDRETFPPKVDYPETVGPVAYDNIFQEHIDAPPQEPGQKSKNEWWYLNLGLGYAKVSYPDSEKSVIDSAAASPGVSNLSFIVDILSVYFPRKNFKTILGAATSLIVDRYSASGSSVQTSQYLVSASGMHFFGTNVGHGPFVRGDLGFALESRQADGSGLGVGPSGTYLGFGMLAGAGYALPVSSGTRLLGMAFYSVRVFSPGTFSTFGFTLGLLL